MLLLFTRLLNPKSVWLQCFGIKITGDELDQYKIIVLPEYLPRGAFFHVLSGSSSKL